MIRTCPKSTKIFIHTHFRRENKVDESASARENPCPIAEEADIESSISDHESQKDEPSEVMGPRLRKLTEKSQVENKINRLKRQRTSALSAVTRKRNEISSLMADINNLHVVKVEIGCMENFFQQYRNVCESHHKELNEDEDEQAVLYQNEAKEKEIIVYLPCKSSIVVDSSG